MQNKNWPYLSRADIQHTLYTYSTRCNVVYSLLKLCVVCQIDKDMAILVALNVKITIKN